MTTCEEENKRLRQVLRTDQKTIAQLESLRKSQRMMINDLEGLLKKSQVDFARLAGSFVAQKAGNNELAAIVEGRKYRYRYTVSIEG